MGIYDRDYYRNESGHSQFDGRVQGCIILVVIYVSLFVLQVVTRDQGIRGRFQPGPLTEYLELQASKVLDGEVWRVLTYAFVHDVNSIMPLAFNVLFLIWFGRHVEDLYGWKEFLAYYLLAGVLAGVGFVVFAAVLQKDGLLLGPAASVTATLILYALHYPRRTVLLFFVIPCPVWFLVAFHVLNDAVGLFGGRMHPAAFAAHLCAAGLAFVYFRYSLRVSNWLPSLPARKTAPRSKLHIFQEPIGESDTARSPLGVPAPLASVHAAGAVSTATSPALDEHLEAKLDEVLEKVKKYGQDSLTDEERAVLFRASEIYRKRRKSGGN